MTGLGRSCRPRPVAGGTRLWDDDPDDDNGEGDDNGHGGREQNRDAGAELDLRSAGAVARPVPAQVGEGDG